MLPNPPSTSFGPQASVSAAAKPVAKTAPSRLELQEDFGRVIRRIMYSNSGNFQTLPADGTLPGSKTIAVENDEWSMCRSEAQLAAALNKFEVSELLWLRALEVASSFAVGDPRLPQTLDELASLYFARKQYEKAESFGRQALEICKKAYGDYHPKVAYCANNLAGIYFCQEYYKKAEPLCVEVLNIYTRIYDPGHADIGMAHGNLAMLYKKQGKHQLSLTHCESALPIRRQSLGINHHMVRSLQAMHLELLDLCGQTERADKIREEAQASIGWKLFDAGIGTKEISESSVKQSLSKLI